MHAFLVGAIVVGGSIALSVLGMWLVRLKFKPTSLKEHHEVAGYLLSIIGTLYAVLLGLAALVLSLNVLLVFLFSNPYRGFLQIPPNGFKYDRRIFHEILNYIHQT